MWMRKVIGDSATVALVTSFQVMDYQGTEVREVVAFSSLGNVTLPNPYPDLQNALNDIQNRLIRDSSILDI